MKIECMQRCKMNKNEYYKWFPLEELPNSNYEINKMGQIRNIVTGKILNGTRDNWGYKSYTLRYNNKNIHRTAHTMVAKQFIPNPDNLPIVNHKDENKMNPCVDNLEWVTVQKNAKHGTTQKRRSEKLEKPINEYSLDGIYIRTWRSMIAITEYIVECDKDIEFEKMYSIIGQIIRYNNKNTEKKRCAQAFGTPVRAPDVRRCQRACEIEADVSDKRSIMAWVSICDCRKVARLQCLRGEDVPFAGCGRAAFRIFYLGGFNYEKETSSKCCTKMSLLRQPFGFEKCRWYIPH